MIFDIDMLEAFYATYSKKVTDVREKLGRPLTFAEKILYTHLYNPTDLRRFKRGEDYVYFRPNRAAMQDATGQMAWLQFMNSGKSRAVVPSTQHCDHLIIGDNGAKPDMEVARSTNKEVYDFLQSACDKYGAGFWEPGAGIIHQTVLENYAFPGGMMVGSDSHTPNAGGLGMFAVGVGGADVVDVMTGSEWELLMPKLIGVKLTGKLSGWASPKDIILKLTGLLTVKGGTNAVIEYFGAGLENLSATGRATICNMGAEVGATTSLFPFDYQNALFLRRTGRDEVADMATANEKELQADIEVLENPEQYFDQVIVLDLSSLEPFVNGPFTPDAAIPVSKMAEVFKEKGYPENVDVALIGSCTNSSYGDLSALNSIAEQLLKENIKVKSELIVIPGSEQINSTAERDGFLENFRKLGATIMANACGPCIGQWHRHTDDNTRRNSIVNSFNRNFAKRNDGNPNTNAFVASPEMVLALAVGGSFTFNPLTDKVKTEDGKAILLNEPKGVDFPEKGFVVNETGYFAPTGQKEVKVDPNSNRLQMLTPFAPWDGKDMTDMPLLIKAKGKCTTDHISMAGPWLRFRGHLQNISDNLLMGAVNAFNDKTNCVFDQLDGNYEGVSTVAKTYKEKGISSVIVADENYGEGSSREHAAMEPRFLNVKAVIARSFARIHETNLKKQGMLAVTFANKADYDKIQEKDKISILGLDGFAPEKPLKAVAVHADGSKDEFEVNHSYNQDQIEWFKAGSALNKMAAENKAEAGK